MAARIGSLYVDLTMNSRGFVGGMNQAQTATSRAAAAINRDLGLSQRTVDSFAKSSGNKSFKPYTIIAASRAYETAADRANLLRGSLLALTAVAGGFAAALSTNLISRYADTAINLNNQLRTVTDSTANLTAVQGALSDVAERSRSSLQSTVTLYARTARASEQLGLSQEKLLKITETIQKAFSIGGATSAEAQGAAIQLSQGIASDRFSGEEFRSVAENAPVLLRGMAESLGVNIGKLREMAHAGELTADVVTKAILKASDRIESEFGQTVITLDRAITHVDNRLLEFVGNTDKSFGVTSLITKGIVAFGDSLESIIPPLTQVAGLIGAVFLARNKGALGAGIGGLLGGGIGLATGGIEGAIFGASLGGFAGLSATKKGADGLGFIGRIKTDAAASREEVIRLTAATKDLRDETWQAQRAMRAADQATKGNLITQAPKSAQSAVEREQFQIQKLDEKKLALLDAQRESYQKLAAIQSQITPRAAKLVDTQLKGEAKINDLLTKQVGIRAQIASVGADRKAKAVVEGVSSAAGVDEVRQRIKLEKELASTVAATQRAQTAVNERAAKLAALSTEADKKAAAERLAIGRQIMAQTDDLNKLDAARITQTQALATARASAERAGAEVAKANLQQTTTNFLGLQRALDMTVGRLDLAKKAASGFQIGMRAVSRGVGDLIGLFGGPWGVAITGASLVFAQFAISAQERAQKIANAKRIIDEVLSESPQLVPDGGKAGGVLSNELAAIEAEIKQVQTGAQESIIALKSLFGIGDPAAADPLTEMARSLTKIANIPIQGQLDKLYALTAAFSSGQVDVVAFQDGVAALVEETNNTRFAEIASQVLAFVDQIVRADAAVGGLEQKIVDLRESAKDPINLLITTTFDTLDKQPVDPGLTSATSQAAAGLGFTRGLDKELETLRLVGDARKRAEYTDEQLAKADKAGITITDAVRKRIKAFVDEKIALENRDAAIKKSEKDDPYEKAVQALHEKTAALQLENQMLGQTTYAIEREKTIRDLENAAIEARIKLTPDLYSSIISEADAYATAAQAAEDLAAKRKAQEEDYKFYQSTFSSLFVDLKNNLLEGTSLWDSFANAAYNALNKIADKALGLAADGIFDLLFGSLFGGGFSAGGLVGGFSGAGLGGSYGFGLYDKGGYTGIGGKYSPAGVVHKGEYVFDAEAVRRIGVNNLEKLRGFADGGYVSGHGMQVPANDWAANSNITVTYAPVINGASGLSRRDLEATLKADRESFRRELPRMIGDARRRGGM